LLVDWFCSWLRLMLLCWLVSYSLQLSTYRHTTNKCKITKFIKDGYRHRSCTKTAKIHGFVRFVMYCFITRVQGCGLGLDVSVSRRTNVSSRSRLKKNCQCLGLRRQTSWSRLGLGHTSPALDQFSAKLCRPHYAV